MTAHAALITRQYDELIAHRYDRDPQGVAGRAVERALDGVLETLSGCERRLRALDLGVGTGRFFERLRARGDLDVEPFGVDTSHQMAQIASLKIPDLTTAIGDAAELHRHFAGMAFDLISTHFVTGYVPIADLAPQIHDRLAPGGLWSFVGGTRRAFPALRRLGESWWFRAAFRAARQRVDDHLLNPADLEEVLRVMQEAGFDVTLQETFLPRVAFGDFDEFLSFAHGGGWLTPLVEAVGLHRASPMIRRVFDRAVFPIRDHHDVAIVLARRRD